MKARKLNGAFWRNLKRYFGSWKCLENVETKEAKWCIRKLFKEYVRRLRGAIECGNMFITEITINKTIRYNVKLLVSCCCFHYFRFLNTPVYLQTLKDMTYSLNCISVLLCTQPVYFVWAVVMGLFPRQTSTVIVFFQNKQSVSAGHTV